MKKTFLGTLLALLLGLAVTTIYAQATIWACSNHNPQHTATSTQQMQDLTRQHGCSGWHAL